RRRALPLCRAGRGMAQRMAAAFCRRQHAARPDRLARPRAAAALHPARGRRRREPRGRRLGSRHHAAPDRHQRSPAGAAMSAALDRPRAREAGFALVAALWLIVFLALGASVLALWVGRSTEQARLLRQRVAEEIELTN